MTNLINSKVRFALDPDTGMIFDYLTNKHHKPVGTLHDHDGGRWDLAEVAHALKNEQPVESAHYRGGPRQLPPPRKGKAKDLTEHDETALPDLRAPAPEAEEAETPASNQSTGQQTTNIQPQGGGDEQTDNGAAQGAS